MGTINALLFAALITNLSPGGYAYFITPEAHVGTLLATGLLIYLFDFEKIKKASRAYVLAICAIAGLVALSDKIFRRLFCPAIRDLLCPPEQGKSARSG